MRSMQEEVDKSSSSGGSDGGGGKKRRMRLWPFRRLKMKESWKWRLKFLTSTFRWKRLNLQLSFFDDLLFKIMSILEAIVLVATLCFFFLCCGCHF